MCKAACFGIDGIVGWKTKVITETVEEIGVLVCKEIEKDKNDTVCPGAVKEMGDVIVPALASFLFTSDYLCSRQLRLCPPVFRELDL